MASVADVLGFPVLAIPHRTVCAWCQADGVETVLQEGVLPESHGICERHAAAFLEECERDRVARGLDVV